ncbi:MAG: MFS transporter [Cellulosilyticaceae bacterium]
MNILHTYSNLKAEHRYWKLFVASCISRFGDSIDAIAFSWMAYELTGSATWLALIMGVNALPSIIFQPFAGVLVERMSKKALMVWTDFGRGAVVFATALLLCFGYLTPWLLLIFTFMNSTFESFRIPAGLAAYPEIISKEKYTLATSLSQSTSQICQLIGMGLAGIIIARIGTSGAIMIDALTFFASGIILSTLHLAKPLRSTSSFSWATYTSELKEGFIYLKSRTVIFAVSLIGILMGVILVPLNTFQVAYISESLGLDATALSVSSIALLLGLAIGSYIFPILNKRWSRYSLFIIGWIGAMLTYFALSFLTHTFNPLLIWLLLIIIFFLCGSLVSLITISVNVAFMEHVEESYLARAGSIFNALVMAATPLASFIFAGAATFMSINQIFFFTAIGGMLICIPMYLSRALKNL